MPLAWIYDLSKQQAEELARQLGLSTDGTLDDLRKRVKEKWTAIEPCLPFPSTAKSSVVTKPVLQSTDSVGYQGYCLNKVKLKLATDLISAIPVLSVTDPEEILTFLIRAKGVFDLKLVSDSEFMALLVSRTSGRITQILGAHVGTTQCWGLVQTEIISTFLPCRVKERFLASHVLERFQSPGEDLNSYVMSVVAAADILGFSGSEAQLVQRMLQNLHPKLKSYLLFATRPESIKDLFSLATTVAEAVAVENQRKRTTASAQQGCVSRPVASGMVIGQTPAAKADSRRRCWGCGAPGHNLRDCPSRPHQRRAPGSSGNDLGARE